MYITNMDALIDTMKRKCITSDNDVNNDSIKKQKTTKTSLLLTDDGILIEYPIRTSDAMDDSK